MAAIVKPHEYLPINGIKVEVSGQQVGPNRKVPPRQNIDEWSHDPANEKQVALFVMALLRFQQIDPHERNSYFQIAGIHGQPNVPWDEPNVTSEADGKGYCTHNNLLFPLWHRVYLVLYEQRIHDIMVNEIVPKIRDQAEAWKQAAASWRLPFWDWGVQNTVPELAKHPTIIVPNDDGTGERMILNPLYQFRMPNNKPMSSEKMDNFKDPWVDQGDVLYYGECVGTSRWPEEEDKESGSEAWRHGTVNNFKVRDSLSQPQWVGDAPYGHCAEMTYRLLTVPMDYPSFATTAQLSDDQSVANDINIEYLHNNVHGWVGGDFNGHMSQIPVATFDPLFWLHHCNIDRIFAIWQALNPKAWFDSSTVNEFFQEIIGLAVGEKITPLTELRPFHRDTKGTLARAHEARYTYDWGYTYTELQTWDPKYNPNNAFSEQLFLNDLRKTINEKYGVARKLLTGPDAPKLNGVEYLDEMVKSLDFAFSIRYCKYGLGGDPFWVRLYLSTDGKERNPTIDLITEVYNFSQKPETAEGKTNCENCKVNQKKNIKVTANISITPVLVSILKSGKDLSSLSKADVLEYLKKRIYWRVFRSGKEVPQYLLDPLELEIIGTSNDNTSFRDPTKAPVIENFKPEPELTGGKDGAFDPALKQPVTAAPPPKPDLNKAKLSMNTSIPLKEPLKTDGVVILDSTSLKLDQSAGPGLDNTQVYLSSKEDGTGDILVLVSFRREEKQIVFNTKTRDWGKEVRVPLPNRFKTAAPSILIHDQGEGYEVMVDYVHVNWFAKRPDTKDQVAKAVHYTVNDGRTSVLSRDLTVRVFPSMRAAFPK